MFSRKRKKLGALAIVFSVLLAESSPLSADEYTARETDTYKATAYCPCSRCCGKSDGITATGTKAIQGRTIAVDKRVIPLGSTVLVYLDGELYGIYIAEDTGVKGNKIDIFFESHSEAWDFGVKEVTIQIVDAKG